MSLQIQGSRMGLGNVCPLSYQEYLNQTFSSRPLNKSAALVAVKILDTVKNLGEEVPLIGETVASHPLTNSSLPSNLTSSTVLNLISNYTNTSSVSTNSSDTITSFIPNQFTLLGVAAVAIVVSAFAYRYFANSEQTETKKAEIQPSVPHLEAVMSEVEKIHEPTEVETVNGFSSSESNAEEIKKATFREKVKEFFVNIGAFFYRGVANFFSYLSALFFKKETTL